MPREICLVHGNAFVAERGGPPFLPVEGLQGTEIGGHAQGSGRAWRARMPFRLWFHCAIPVQMREDEPARLEEVFVRLETKVAARLVAVRVFDGAERVAAIDGLSGQGDLTRDLVEGVNRFTVQGAPALRYGLGLSCQIGFNGAEWSDVRFAAAGAVLRIGA